MVNHVTLLLQRENASFAAFDTTEYLKHCNNDAKHDQLKIFQISTTSFDAGLNSPEFFSKFPRSMYTPVIATRDGAFCSENRKKNILNHRDIPNTTK